jgi:hypothetical protein
MARKGVEKWYSAGEPLNWRKSDKTETRRRKALAARHGDALATAHALQALANVSKDPETQRKADADARYFFDLHNKRKQGRG